VTKRGAQVFEQSFGVGSPVGSELPGERGRDLDLARRTQELNVADRLLKRRLVSVAHETVAHTFEATVSGQQVLDPHVPAYRPALRRTR
jgi:hypothetical protein